MKKFWIQLTVFLLFSLIIPITYIGIRFKLFTSTQTISVWAILILAILTGVIVVLIKYYISGLKTRYSLIKQVLEGITKVILPLLLILVMVIWFKNKADWLLSQTNLVIELLIVLISCESIAIIVNPLPKWAFDNNVEGLAEITNKIFNKGESE